MNKTERNNLLDVWVDSFITTGDEKFFTLIYENIESDVFKAICYKERDLGLAKEILSFSMERIYIALTTGKYTKINGVNFQTWAITTAINAWKYHNRYYKKFIPFDVAVHQSDMVDTIETDVLEKAEEVKKFINEKLTEKNDLRKIGRMFYLQNYIMDEISEELDIGVSMVKNRLRLIKRDIRKYVNLGSHVKKYI